MRVQYLASSILLLTLLSSNISAANMEEFKSFKVKVSSPLTKAQKSKLYDSGVKSIKYIGDMNYYIVGESSIKDLLSKSSDVISISDYNDSDKLDKEINKKGSSLGDMANDDRAIYTILFVEEMSREEIEEYLKKADIDVDIIKVSSSLRTANIRANINDLERLKSLALIEYIQKSVSFGATNSKTRRYEGVDKVASNTLYGLDADGMRVAVVDGGMIRATHQEFYKDGYSRVHDIGDYEYADHATHVGGTIAAAGVDNKAKGMATEAEIYSFSFNDGAFGEMATYIYNSYDILFSNHSYGYNEKMQLGSYDSEAVKQDRAVYQNPYLNIFEAAGNDGDNPSYPAYGKIKGPANSKNILTIGALNLNSAIKASFSSNGPVKDGRIKPDLCVRGEGIYSSASQNDSDYLWMNGTSMATPGATGMALLVAQEYKKVSGGYDIRHDILKSVLINSAIDKGRYGPDYDTGFGMIDVKGAVDEIRSIESSKPLVLSDRVGYQESKRYDFSLQESGEFKVTLSWIDPAGSPNSSNSLVNDLDMVLVSSDGKRYYPFTLDPANPTALAKSDRENHIDNIEQIAVKNLPSGEYSLIVKGSVVVTEVQEYAIASNISVSQKSNIITLQPSKLKNFAKVIQASLR